MIEIVRGPRPGAIGRIAQLHGEYYAAAWKFDATFEAYVAREVADFITRFDAKRDGLWLAIRDGVIEGLDAAIALYQAHGFRLAEEGPLDRWGASILEQRFVREVETHS